MEKSLRHNLKTLYMKKGSKLSYTLPYFCCYFCFFVFFNYRGKSLYETFSGSSKLKSSDAEIINLYKAVQLPGELLEDADVGVTPYPLPRLFNQSCTGMGSKVLKTPQGIPTWVVLVPGPEHLS